MELQKRCTCFCDTVGVAVACSSRDSVFLCLIVVSLCLVSVVSVCYVVAIIFGVFSVSPIAHPLMRKKERKNGN